LLLLPADAAANAIAACYFLLFPGISHYFLAFLLFPAISYYFLSLTFRGFSLAAQYPPRLHDFTCIPSILKDTEGNECFCLLFSVSA